ncbi:hypothetical protein A0H81_02376 [Grifola frondosa]|uniref:S-Me-THD-like C-terminal domain-containing protein n=1 Tax=Grifola frondosa TaxID=5627 RepID=A0A1C7MKU2_GRIFR|nr:hypothetical protein A0H81_02376 [Grifola frondosa]
MEMVQYSAQDTVPKRNLYAYVESPDGSRKILVTVPDLITVLDSQNGAPLGTPDYRIWIGHIPFTPIAHYKQPISVIVEYA